MNKTETEEQTLHRFSTSPFMKQILFIALFSASVAQVDAGIVDIIQFDLQGRSGVGMRFDNENPTSASGSGTGGENGSGIFYDNALNILTLNVGWGSGKGFSDLTGAVSVAHIHQAPDALFTSSGGAIITLSGATPGFSNSNTDGGWTNTTVTLNAAQETALLSGFLYLNAHTTANTNGEIRGNLVPVPEPSTALLGLFGCASLLAVRRRG